MLGEKISIGPLDNLLRAKSSDPEESEQLAAHRVQIDPDRAEELLESLGIEVLEVKGDELVGLCPMHKARTGKQDHSPSWSFNRESGLHGCFSCLYGGGVLRLVADLRELETKWGFTDWAAAAAWVRDFEVSIQSKVANSLMTYRATDRAPKLVPMTEARLAVFDAEIPSWALDARKLDQEACTKFGVLWDPKTECWITPLRDPETKKLIGYQQKGQGNRFFRNRPPGTKKSQTLFGLDCFDGGTMIVVESPLDCLRLDVLGYPGAVSTCGAKVSPAQASLMAWRADAVILAMDNDPAGHKALEEFSQLAQDAGILRWSCLNYSRTAAKDVGDMPAREVEWAVDHAVDSLWGVNAMLAGRSGLKEWF